MSLISVDKTITLALSVTDRHASATWYQDMLGFELLYHADDAGWSELRTNTPGVSLGLGEHTKPAPGNCVPVFGVAELDSARQALEQAKCDLMAKRMWSKAWSRPRPSMIRMATR